MAKHASGMTIIYDPSDWYRALNIYQKDRKKVLRYAFAEAMRYIGLVATGKYMRVARLSGQNYDIGWTVGEHGGKLNIRTQRLARSLIGGFTFTTRLAGMKGAGMHVPVNLGGAKEGIRRIVSTGNTIEAIYGSKVPYAEIHEKGGEIPITDRMRKFFWAMWYESKGRQLMWKYLALSPGPIRIPQRSYLEPALNDSRLQINLFVNKAAEILAMRMA